MVILNAILVCAGVAALASVINLFDNKSQAPKHTPMEVQLPGNLPIIALSTNNGEVLNFIVDSGSNISHICAEHYEALGAELLGVYKDGEVVGLGAKNTGITMCKTNLSDVLGNKYEVNLSVSEQFSAVARGIEANTGMPIHGLLGTDFLMQYGYVIDFKSLEVYSK
jgi:hypothetical protein